MLLVDVFSRTLLANSEFQAPEEAVRGEPTIMHWPMKLSLDYILITNFDALIIIYS